MPDVRDLGPRPTPQATRGVQDVSVAGRGVQEAADIATREAAKTGTGLTALGESLGAASATLEEAQESRDRVEVADADAAWTTSIINLGSKYRDDQDFSTLTTRYGADVDRLHDEIAGRLSPQAREVFDRRSSVDAARAKFAMEGRAHSLGMNATRASLDSELAAIRRIYLESSDVAGLEQAAFAARAAITAAVERGAISLETAGELRRRFLEDVALGRVAMLTDTEQITALQSDAGITQYIDPARRAVLLREAQARRDAVVKGEVADAVAVLERGRTPEGLPGLTAAVEGTAFEVPLREAVEDREAVATFLQLPLVEQAAELKAAPETTNRRDLATEDRKRRAHSALRKEIDDGRGLVAAAQLGVFAELAPLDLSDPETLRRRAVQARIASAHFGVPVAPLLPSEADAIAEQLEAAPADEATGTLAGLVAGFGREDAMAFVGLIADKHPELALATVNVAERPLLAREIIAGGRLLGENKDVAPQKADRQAAIAEVFGTDDRSLFTPDTATALAPILDAAVALYAGRRVPTGDFTYDSDIFEDALAEVVGGVFTFNGRNIIAPIAGMDEDAFDDAMESLTQPDLIEFGNGVPMFANGDPFTVSMFESRFFGPEAQLITAGFGRYLIAFPGLGFLMTDAGEPYELNLGAFIRGRQ